jgi:hypothetical protein
MSDFYPRSAGFGGVHQDPLPASVLTPIGTTLTSVSLSWTAVPGAASYNLYMSTVSGQETASAAVFQGNALTATITGLNEDTEYFFLVYAVDGSGVQSGIPSNEVNATTTESTFYIGFSPSAAPNATQVQALTAVPGVTPAGTYTMNQPGTAPQYPCFAFPQIAGLPNTFSLDGIQYTLNETQVAIGGQTYNVYTSAYATFAPTLTWTIT